MNYSELFEKFNISQSCDTVWNKSTSALCSFKIGSDCIAAVYPKSTDGFVGLIKLLRSCGAKYTVIGNGSNIVFPDERYEGIVVCTSKMNEITVNENRIYARCGAMLNSVCQTALTNGLSGLEFAYGIPGSVGGGIFMNAGAYGGELCDITESVTVYDTASGEIRDIPGSECGFGYRTSMFQNSELYVLGAVFELKKGERTEIKEKMTELLSRRHEKQPLNYPSAGSAFKRYPGRYTGQMIEQAGLKGFSVGGAQVSELHAGFIINTGKATCRDVKELTEIIKKEIKKREGIDIECEIRFIE